MMFYKKFRKTEKNKLMANGNGCGMLVIWNNKPLLFKLGLVFYEASFKVMLIAELEDKYIIAKSKYWGGNTGFGIDETFEVIKNNPKSGIKVISTDVIFDSHVEKKYEIELNKMIEKLANEEKKNMKNIKKRISTR